MSYPGTLQALIIEDDLRAKENYDAALDPLIESGQMARPRYAFCYQDAIRQLREDTVFHLVILDLQLPDAPGMPAVQGIALGEALLKECAGRNRYPIPAMIVRSGHLDAANQIEMQESVTRDFWHGVVLMKGAYLEQAIELAIERIRAYGRVGVHLRDAGNQQYPTLSPRDEDLLRRSILGSSHEGVDFQWWSADLSKASGEFAECAGWTRTLMGRFMLTEGMGLSLPTFFKFVPYSDAAVLRRGATILSQKLTHVKMVDFLSSGDRCLLITQKVGDGPGAPISLEQYLGRDPNEVVDHLPAIVEAVVSQTESLGASTPDMAQVRELLWPYHNHVAKQWEQWSQEIPNVPFEIHDPSVALHALLANETSVRYTRRTCLHGDLNITNIALDVFSDAVRAYIFDAGWCTQGVSARDLALLEVTALLHQRSVSENLVAECAGLYGDTLEVPMNPPNSSASVAVRNTYRLIAQLRSRVLPGLEDQRIYPLLVFDAALLQLGGLEYQLSSNKVRDPRDAALLAALAARWLKQNAPEFF